MGEIWLERPGAVTEPQSIAWTGCNSGSTGSPTGLIRAKMGLAERIDAHLAWPSKPKGLFAAFNNPDGPPWLKQMVENFSLQKDFTPEEARFVLKGRLHHIFSSLQFNISRSAILDSYMRHAGGSSTVWARHYGWCRRRRTSPTSCSRRSSAACRTRSAASR